MVVAPPDGLEPKTAGDISRKHPHFFLLFCAYQKRGERDGRVIPRLVAEGEKAASQ